jgi:hypothetical protein
MTTFSTTQLPRHTGRLTISRILCACRLEDGARWALAGAAAAAMAVALLVLI